MLQQPGKTLIATLDGNKQRERSVPLMDAGADVEFFPPASLLQGDAHIDLQLLLEELSKRACNQVMVEAGATLAGAFIAQGLLDELVCYWAPKLFGDRARPMFKLPINRMDAHLALSIRDIQQVGEDIKVTLYPDKDY
jgi:diaminohydroxyphosphoribosylaminopyrimidine deaminase/5-amino-6-(5-phosphoribosylamino)uracil reductase